MERKSHEVAALRELLTEAFKEDIAEPPPEWLAITQKIFRGKLEPFIGTSYEEMVAFILKDTGISEKQFNDESPKSLGSLYDELQREVSLNWNSAESPSRQIVRIASNSRCIIYSPTEDLALCEVGRLIKKSGVLFEHAEPKHFGCSETAMRRRELPTNMRVSESPLVTMQRGFLEEAGLAIPSEHLIPLTASAPEPNDHESSVYRCSATFPDGETPLLTIRSIVMSYVFGLDITSLGMNALSAWAERSPTVTKKGDLYLVEDQGVVLAHKALPLSDSWRRLLLAKIAQKKT